MATPAVEHGDRGHPDRAGRSGPGGTVPLSPKRKWQTITVATLLLVPAFWSLLAGLVAAATDDPDAGPHPAAAILFGLAVLPFVYIVLAFMSGHPRAPRAVLGAMGMALLVGIPVSALAADAVTGLTAGIGAGGAVALRSEPVHDWKARALAVCIAAAYVYVLARTLGALTLLPAPVFPFTAIGIADHLSERRHERTERGR